MRYLLVHRVERETNNELKSSLLGSDRPSGLCNSYNLEEVFVIAMYRCSDILCCVGVMFAVKESDLRSAKRFPSQQKSSESAK